MWRATFLFFVTPIFGLALMTPSGASAQTTALILDSQPGDYIGGGIDQTFTPSDGTFFANRNFDNGVSISFNGGPHWWNLDFAAPLDAALAVGVYENATRFPFQSPTLPGLTVYGEGRGCNQSTGRFEVLEVVYGPAGEVERFAATFEQHCEGVGPALLGSVLYNSTLPPPPTGPSHCPSTVATLPELVVRVNLVASTQATRAVLFPPLFAAQSAIANGAPRLARTLMGLFMSRAIAVSNLDPSDPNALPVGTGNVLVCGAGNVLTNIIVP